MLTVLLVFVGVVALALPGYIPRCLMTSWESDHGDFAVCFSLISVSVIGSVDTSRRLEASMSSLGEIKIDISLDLYYEFVLYVCCY